MDRVSGWYKRRTQTIVLAIVALITIATNADTFAIATALANNSALREAVIAEARTYMETPKSPEGAPKQPSVGERIADLQQVGIPLGWRSRPSHPGDWWNKLAGLALTAFAVSLGAPFWFDLLNRFMNIRSAGKSPNEKPKDADSPKST